MKFILGVCFFLTLNASAETLMVSINKTIPVEKIQEFVNRLNQQELTAGPYYFQAAVSKYIRMGDPTARNPPYYGVALVEIDDNSSAQAKRNYLNWLASEQKAGNYTLYSDPVFEPMPIGGGRNSPCNEILDKDED